MEQREVDNMLLSMIQKHFPSLPLSDEHTDWGKWLGFARAVYEAGRASPASVPEGWKLVPIEATIEMREAGWNEYDLQEHFSVRFMYERMIAAAPTPPVSEDRWQPIETAPRDSKTMFVVIGISVDVGNAFPYTTDPWCVWRTLEGRFERWPHKFQPTHWMPLPKAPAMQEDKP